MLFRWLLTVIGGAILGLGLVVLVGWHIGNLHMVELRPAFGGMAYNSAFSFAVLGAGLAALGWDRRGIGRFSGAVVGLLMLLSVVDYLNGPPLDSATFLTRFSLPVGRLHPIPVAPNTMVGLFSLAVALLMLDGSWRWRWAATVATLPASLGLLLGVNGLAGYIFGLNTFTWAAWVPMAAHTAVGIVSLGVGLLALSWQRTGRDETGRTRWLLVLSVTAGLVTSFSFWEALKVASRSQLPDNSQSFLANTVLFFGLLVTVLLTGLIFWLRQARARMLAAERAERELRDSERNRIFLSLIVDSTEDGIIGKDLNGTILSWNRGAEKLYGYSAQEMVGHSVTELCAPDRQGEPLQLIEKIVRGEKVEQIETERIRKGGELIDVSLTVSAIRDVAGNVTGISTTARDVTKRKKMEAALQASEQLLRSVIDSSTDLIFAKDPALRTILCNEAYARALGKPVSETCGKTDIELGWDPEQVQGNPARGIKGWQSDDRTALGGETIHVTSEPCSFGGSVHFFDTIKTPFRNAAGEVIGLVGISRDITELLARDAALKESDAAFRTLADAVPQLVWMCAPDGLNIYFNRQWVDYTGLTLEQSYGRAWDTPFHPEERGAAWAAWNHAVETGEIYLVESRLRAKDGSYRWFLMRGIPLRDADGTILKWVGTCTDIHDLKRAEEKLHALNVSLQQANAYHRNLIEASLDPLAAIGKDGKITDVNRASEEATGLSRQALIGTDFSSYFSDPERARSCYQLAAEQGSVCDVELALRHRDGSVKPVLFSASQYYGQDGEPAGIIAAARDISILKQREQAIQDLNVELEQRVAARTADLLSLNRELESFNSSVAHDLRSPLRHLDGYAKILLREQAAQLNPDGRKCIERICGAANRMGRMVDELLELSRISRRQLSKEPTDLESVVREVIEEKKAETGDREIEWRVGALPVVESDEMLIRLVFENLLSNAVKFSRPRKKAVIEIGYEVSGEEPSFFVRDNGVGFSMKYSDKLFGIFQRLHRREDFEGTGIGLVTVQRIIHKHGGRIWAQAEVEKGATFYFTLGVPNRPSPLLPDLEPAAIS